MDTSTTPRTRRKSARAGILLLLYVLTMVGVSRAIGEMDSLPERLGALSVPLALLGAGCWFAFKDGGRGPRIFAVVLSVCFLGSLGYGAFHGFRNAYDRQQGAREANAEIEELRAGLAADASETDLSAEAARRHRDRTQDAARRMQASEHAETAALGRAMEMIASLTSESEQRLLTAIDAVASERFLDVSRLLEARDFEWQRATAHEYGSAAKASHDFNDTLPDVVKERLTQSNLTAEASQQVVNGVSKVSPFNARALHGHVRTAEAYEALVDFLEAHHSEIKVLEDRSLDFADGETESAYDELIEKLSAAEEQRDAAIDALMEAVAKR